MYTYTYMYMYTRNTLAAYAMMLFSTQLYAENEELRQKIIELERCLESKEYFAMMYKIVCDDASKES